MVKCLTVKKSKSTGPKRRTVLTFTRNISSPTSISGDGGRTFSRLPLAGAGGDSAGRLRHPPPSSAIVGGFAAVAITFGWAWIIEPLSYYPVLGVPGTYMAFLSGNISNLRLPCAAAAQEAADVEAGTPQASIISTVAIAASIFVNTAMLGISAFALVSVFQALPELWRNALESYHRSSALSSHSSG